MNHGKFIIKNNNKEIRLVNRGQEKKWDIPKSALDSLKLDEFDLTWALAPGGSMSIPERFNNVDNNETSHSFHIRKDQYSDYNYRNINGYHIIDVIPVDMIKEKYKDRKVEYRYNSDWFRSDHFVNKHDGVHILFGGCSNTEGVGANIENTWSHMLHTEINKNIKTSGYFSIARAGAGWHRLLQNFMTYVQQYGSPDYFIMLFPNILRGFEYVDEKIGWRYQQTNPWGDQAKLESNIKLHRDEFPVWALSMKLFSDYCASLGTKLIWSIWDGWEDKNITNCLLFQDSYFSMPDLSAEYVVDNYEHLLDREDAIEARDGHDGYLQQMFWYENFKNELHKRGELNV